MKSGKAIGIVFGITLIFSFVFAGCETGTTPTANTGSKTVIIADFPGSSNSGNYASISLHSTYAFTEITALGVVPIRSNRLTVPLYIGTDDEIRWDGSGEYYVLLMIQNDEWEIEKVFIYSYEEPNDFLTNVPMYSFTERVSTIYFDEFYDITEWAWAEEDGTVPTPTTPNADSKTIVITGFPGSSYSGKGAAVTLHSSFDVDEITAIGAVPVTGNRLVIPLYTDEYSETEWKGTGDYFVLFMIGNYEGIIERVFIYSDEVPNDYGTNVPMYSITERESTIPFSEFLDITNWAVENGIL
jgi:hypothetical protein